MKTFGLFSSFFFALSAFAQVPVSSSESMSEMLEQELGVVKQLTAQHVNYSTTYAAEDFGLPAPDTLRVRTADGYGIFAYECRPRHPKAVVICLSGIENPSVTAFFGHAAEFYRRDVATLLPDLRGHGKSDGERICLAYEETADVRALTNYVKTVAAYRDVPVLVFGLSMGAAVGLRAIGENEDIDAVISLSSFSSFEDFMECQRSYLLPGVSAEKIRELSAVSAALTFGVNPYASSPLHALRGLKGRPVLLMHSRKDLQMPFVCFERLLSAAQASSSAVSTYVAEGDEHFVCSDFLHPSTDRPYFDALINFLEKVVGR